MDLKAYHDVFVHAASLQTVLAYLQSKTILADCFGMADATQCSYDCCNYLSRSQP